MRLLWITWLRALESHSHLSGSERIERLSSLSREGVQAYLLSGNFPKSQYQESKNLHLVSIPLKYVPIISPVLYGLALFFFLPLYIIKIRPDYILSDISTTPSLIWKPFLSKLLKFKAVLDIRSTPVNTRRHRSEQTIFNFSIWIAKTMFDGITIVTTMMKKELCQKFGLRLDRVSVLSNGISDDFVNYTKQKCNAIALKEKLGLSNKFVIIYHGSFRSTGGLFESIAAMKLIKKDYPDIVLFLLGTTSPQLLRALRRVIETNDVQNNVIIHGSVSFHEVPDFISISDVGLVPLPNIPTWRFQQPLKLLEYMSMGKMIIAVNSPAHRDAAGESNNVKYVSNLTPNALSDAIIFTYNNKEKLENWGRQGRQVVLEKYVWKKVNAEFIKYLSII
jgi:glycosyltransferase involved in cell wall biosynthesis